MKPILISIIIVILSQTELSAKEVLVLGDSNIVPINEIIQKISETFPDKVTVYKPSGSTADIEKLIAKESAKVVVSIGFDYTKISLSIPPDIPVVYSLSIKPVLTNRQNITGVYIETPLGQYLELIERYFPDISKIAVIDDSGFSLIDVSQRNTTQSKKIKAADSAYLIAALNAEASEIQAIVLTPNSKFMGSATLDEIYLFSFRNKKPVLGLSEKNVKAGSLLAVVFNLSSVALKTSELVNKVLQRGSAEGIGQMPPSSYDIYINLITADKMNVKIPQSLIDVAKKVIK